MTNKIDTLRIVREQQIRIDEKVQSTNADYVTRLEDARSIMPPEKPFETEAAQRHSKGKERDDVKQSHHFVKKSRELTNQIVQMDQSNETKLHLLLLEYQKIADKLGDPINKKEKSELVSHMNDVDKKIELYKSKLNSGGGIYVKPKEEEEAAGDGDGSGDGGPGVMDGLKDQILGGLSGIIIGAKDDEEEEETKHEDSGFIVAAKDDEEEEETEHEKAEREDSEKDIDSGFIIVAKDDEEEEEEEEEEEKKRE